MTSVKQSVSWWCFESSELTPDQLIRTAAQIGYTAFYLVGPEHWPLIKEYGMEIAAIDGHKSIEMGLNRREQHDRIEREILANLELAHKWGITNLIVFSGNRAGLDDAD